MLFTRTFWVLAAGLVLGATITWIVMILHIHHMQMDGWSSVKPLICHYEPYFFGPKFTTPET